MTPASNHLSFNSIPTYTFYTLYTCIYIYIYVLLYTCMYDPGFRFRAPPPEWVGSTQEKGRSSMLVCVEASQHALHVYIHTHRLYAHTYILTDKYIHTPIHACTYRHAPPHPQGGRGILYIHTYILTDKYIHTPIHACTYRHAPPHPQGGAGHTIHTHIHTYIQIHTYTIPFGGGGVGPADLDHVYKST